MPAAGEVAAPVGADRYCLKWNNYQSSMVNALADLKLDGDFVDCTVAVSGGGGGAIRAHRVVLSACSEYFRDVFKVLLGFPML